MTLPILRTSRLALRPPEAQDADFITAAMQDRAIWEWLSVIPQPYTRADALHFIEKIAPDEAWVIEKDGTPQGVIGLGDELGYWLMRAAWGQGVITEAGDAVIDWAFADPARTEILSSHFAANDRSRNALEKLGFVDVSAKVSSCLSDGRQDIPGRQMRLTRARWQDRRQLCIETPRLKIREMWPEDATDFARICGHPQVAPNLMAMTVGWPEEAAARMIAASRFRGRIPFRATICLDGRMIGTCGIGPSASPSIMYALDPAHWWQGYMTEAMLAFLAEIDRRFAPTLIEADHFTDNPASGTVLHKLGFCKTGESTGTSAAREGAHPVVTYERRALHTERLLLRPLRPSDAEALHRIISVWEVTRQLGSWPWPPDPAFTASRAIPYEGDGAVWAITMQDRLIGTIGVTRKEAEAPSLGYQLADDAHGQGLMTEAARAALSDAFARTDWPEITASTWEDNAASQGLLRKLGFRKTGESMAHSGARNAQTRLNNYRLTRKDWAGSSHLP